MRTPAAIAALLIAAVGAHAGDVDETEKARAEFEAICVPSRADETGPSLTARVAALLSRGQTIVRAVENEAWDATKREDTIAFAAAYEIEHAIRFLHGMPPRRDPCTVESGDSSGYDVLGGAVVRRSPSGYHHRGPSISRHLPVSFQELVKGSPLRPLPAPTASDLLAAAEGQDVRSALDDLATALGEACARDQAALSELWTRAKEHPDDLLYVRALGWTGAPDSATFLAERMRVLAKGYVEGDGCGDDDQLLAAANALAHVDPERLAASIPKLPEKARRPAATALGRDWYLLRRLATLAAATEAPFRNLALLQVLDVDPNYEMWPRGDRAREAIRVFLEAAESKDAGLRAAADGATFAMFYGWNRYPINGSSSMNGVTTKTTGARVGSYCSTSTLLRQLDADLVAGRLAFPSARPHLLDRRPKTPWKAGELARTDAPRDPDVGTADAVPVHVAGTWTPKGLHLQLRNDAKTPLAVDPVGLRYGAAEKVTVTTQRDGEAPRVHTELRLDLRFIREHVAVPAASLVTLEPGEVFECDLAVRADLYGCDHVVVELGGSISVEGGADAPLVLFYGTPVR